MVWKGKIKDNPDIDKEVKVMPWEIVWHQEVMNFGQRLYVMEKPCGGIAA